MQINLVDKYGKSQDKWPGHWHPTQNQIDWPCHVFEIILTPAYSSWFLHSQWFGYWKDSSNIWVQTWGWRLQNSLLEFPGKTWPCRLKWWLKHLILWQLWVQSFCLVLKSHILHFRRNEQVTQRWIRLVSINWYEIWKDKWEQSIPINWIKGLVQNYNMVTKCNN